MKYKIIVKIQFAHRLSSFASQLTVLVSRQNIQNVLFYFKKQSGRTNIFILRQFISDALNIFLLLSISTFSLYTTACDFKLLIIFKVRRLYEIGTTKEHLREKISQYLPNIQYFLHHYIQKQTTEKAEQKQDNWQGVIQSIEDIEENIWCPELGLKGKVDVSVKSAFNVLPLEIKTGRASFSLEHKGQVMMYVMMMQKMGYKVSSGLLLYLR